MERETCTNEKQGLTCIKFPGHPGRCRFARKYTKPLAEQAKEQEATR